MSKSEINSMSVEELIDKIGYSKISNVQLVNVIMDMYKLEAVTINKNCDIYIDEPIQIIKDYPDLVNKEKLVLLLAFNIFIRMNEIMEKDDYIEVLELTKSFQKCLELLDGVDVDIPILKPRGDYIYVNSFLTSEKLLNNTYQLNHSNKKNAEIFKKMEKEHFFDNLDICSNIFKDFYDVVCYKPEDGSAFQFFMDYNLLQFNKNRQSVEKDEESENFILNELKTVFKAHNGRINMDKFLLACSYEASEKLEMGCLDEEGLKKAIAILDFAKENIKGKAVKISKEDVNGKKIECSSKIIDECQSRVLDGQFYISKNVLRKSREFALSGELILKRGMYANEKIARQIWRLMNFSDKERRQVMQNNSENLEFIYLYGELSSDELKQCLLQTEDYPIDKDFIDELLSKEVIEKEDSVHLYKNRNLSLADMIELNEIYNLSEAITVDELMNFYAETKENPDAQHDFERYMLLFKELKVKNKSDEEKSQITEQIVEKIYEINEDEYVGDFKALYKNGLLNIKTVMDWNGEDIAYELIKENGLKPKDAREMLKNGEFNLKKAYHALRTSTLTETEKMNFIFGSFDGSGKDDEEIKLQNEARMYLIQAMNVSKELKNEEDNITSNKAQRNHKSKTERKRYLSDPAYRWRFYSELDEDCTYSNCLDGTVICILPNLNNGTVFFEKIFKNTKNGIHINYGDAIYVTSLEEYLKRKDDIIIEGKFNKRALVEMKEEGKANKFIHAPGYGNKIKTALDISVENDYDEEKIQRIDAIIEKIEKSRELIH